MKGKTVTKMPLERQTTLNRFMNDSAYKDKIKELAFICIKEKNVSDARSVPPEE